jgi:hypothetical protein
MVLLDLVLLLTLLNLQNSTQKIKDRTTRITLKTGMNSGSTEG